MKSKPTARSEAKIEARQFLIVAIAQAVSDEAVPKRTRAELKRMARRFSRDVASLQRQQSEVSE